MIYEAIERYRDNPELDKLRHTAKWKKLVWEKIKAEEGVCEICNKPITGRFITHHTVPATVNNYYDTSILQLLCIECHNTLTMSKKEYKENKPIV